MCLPLMHFEGPWAQGLVVKIGVFPVSSTKNSDFEGTETVPTVSIEALKRQ